jgi:hypothetical protein
MRFSLAVAVALVGMSLSGWAQQNSTLKVKHSNEATKAPKSALMVKTTASPTASTPASMELQRMERQNASSAATTRSAGPRTGKGPALKPAKDKPNPPINFGGTGGSKRAGMSSHGSNPYKGRLKQKGR